jgi:hypothetical protein
MVTFFKKFKDTKKSKPTSEKKKFGEFSYK